MIINPSITLDGVGHSTIPLPRSRAAHRYIMGDRRHARDTTTNHEQPPKSQAAVEVAMVVVASLLLVSIVTISSQSFVWCMPFARTSNQSI
jgi:hypothetical protein